MENAVLQMLEMWLSKERLLSDSTPRFLTDDKELTEQPSSVLGYYMQRFQFRLLTPLFFQNLVVRNYSSSSFLYRICIPLVFQFSFTGPQEV